MNDLEEKINIKDMIYEVRGKQVMLDSDLAMLYNVETKRINEAVKNNPNKFPERFSWVLRDDEEKNLRSKLLTSNEKSTNILRSKFSTSSLSNNYGGRRYNIRVFTEQGVAMLATILKSKIAVQTSIDIMDAFVNMKKYIYDNLLTQKYYNEMTIKHDFEIKQLQDTFDEFDKKKKETDIYFNGQFYDAYYKVHQICNSAKKELVIVDNYADNTLLDIIKRLKVNVTIITKPNNLLTKQDIEKYNKQYHNLKVVFNNTFHDRYFIIDSREVYHCGSSVNKIGSKTFSINKNNDDGAYDSLIERINKII